MLEIMVKSRGRGRRPGVVVHELILSSHSPDLFQELGILLASGPGKASFLAGRDMQFRSGTPESAL